MAFNPDFGQANEAISRAAMAFMQDWVSRRNDQRSMEYLNRSGEMWSEKAKADAALELERMREQNRLSMGSENQKFINKISELPEGRALMASILQKEMMTGEKDVEGRQRLQEMYDAVASKMGDLTTNYNTSGENIMSMFSLFENPQESIVQAMRNRAGDKDRAMKFAELEFEKGKEKNKLKDDVTKLYLKKVSDLRDFYQKIRTGGNVKVLGPNNLPLEFNNTKMSKEELQSLDDMLAQMARVESKFLSGQIDENDVEWIDQGWDYTSKNIAMTKAFERAAKEKDKTFDEIAEEEYSNVMATTGRVDRDFRIGAPIEDALDEATQGEFTFDPATPIELKKLLWETYQDVKRGLEVDDSGKPMVTDAQIWAMILEDEQVGDIAKRYVRKKAKGTAAQPSQEEDNSETSDGR